MLLQKEAVLLMLFLLCLCACWRIAKKQRLRLALLATYGVKWALAIRQVSMLKSLSHLQPDVKDTILKLRRNTLLDNELWKELLELTDRILEQLCSYFDFVRTESELSKNYKHGTFELQLTKKNKGHFTWYMFVILGNTNRYYIVY